jgi:hypothetical protein
MIIKFEMRPWLQKQNANQGEIQDSTSDLQNGETILKKGGR